MDNNTPTVVKIHDVNIDKDYIGWIEELKSRYRRAQIKAAVKVNAEQLLFNWQLGRDLVIRKAEEKWGSGVVEQVSMDLQAAFPESKGFSTSNLWRMKQWYLFYADSEEKEGDQKGHPLFCEGGVAPQRQLASERTPFASLTPIPPIVIAKR